MSKEEDLFWAIAVPIINGKRKVGDALPSYAELSALMGISVSTVNRVMFALRMAGFVSSHQGEATFVGSGWRQAWRHRIAPITSERDITTSAVSESRATPAVGKTLTRHTQSM